MQLSLHPDFTIQKLRFGNENAPLLVIDNFIANAERLIDLAATKTFAPSAGFYPGIRAEAPIEYQVFMLQQLTPLLVEFFDLPSEKMTFSLCHYSLVTAPAERLSLMQRIPHFDSPNVLGLASVHYLFKAPLGGTAFYRHKKTGYEYIDEARMGKYFGSLEGENGGPNIPQAGYINKDSPLYEKIAEQEGIFNRVLIYRRNSLHSGAIDEKFLPDSNPLTGRLSINSFIDVQT